LETFAVAHLRAVASGGATTPENLAAWCWRCNLAQGADDVRDTRITPRAWQLQGLTDPDIPFLILRQGIATVAAAPGGGKSIFAGQVFGVLAEVAEYERIAIFAPRLTLVDQWKEALYRACHLDLDTNKAHERSGCDGTINTYQALNPDSVQIHLARAKAQRTLLVFDEVHHLGESDQASHQRPAWARYAMDIAGEIQALRVAGVLNLSGTLWRSTRGQRISTVRYAEDKDGRILSVVDLEITASDLIAQQQLRPVDLFRRGASVELIDLATATRILGDIADLDDEGPARAAITNLPRDASWRESFTDAILERLEVAYRDLGRAPMKALIVARSQSDARAFQETANARMKARGLLPFTELAISDEPEAARTLARFKTQRRPGLLCTVDMAGEGYDCPEIIVIGYATNKLTPLYVRQVVARAQRVTDFERERIGRPLPAAIVIPDVPGLVEHMKNILTPMRHELLAPGTGPGGPHLGPRYTLDTVGDLRDGDAHITGVKDGDVEMELIRRAQPHVARVGLPEAETPRIVHAVRATMREQHDANPFDPLPDADRQLAESGPTPHRAHRPAVRVEGLAETDHAATWQSALRKLEGWWATNGNSPVQFFVAETNGAARIPTGGRPQASRDQLVTAYEFARTRIQTYCQRTGQPLPKLLEGP
jgi:superfamily II DNA or RNA helicase